MALGDFLGGFGSTAFPAMQQAIRERQQRQQREQEEQREAARRLRQYVITATGKDGRPLFSDVMRTNAFEDDLTEIQSQGKSKGKSSGKLKMPDLFREPNPGAAKLYGEFSALTAKAGAPQTLPKMPNSPLDAAAGGGALDAGPGPSDAMLPAPMPFAPMLEPSTKPTQTAQPQPAPTPAVAGQAPPPGPPVFNLKSLSEDPMYNPQAMVDLIPTPQPDMFQRADEMAGPRPTMPQARRRAGAAGVIFSEEQPSEAELAAWENESKSWEKRAEDARQAWNATHSGRVNAGNTVVSDLSGVQTKPFERAAVTKAERAVNDPAELALYRAKKGMDLNYEADKNELDLAHKKDLMSAGLIENPAIKQRIDEAQRIFDNRTQILSQLDSLKARMIQNEPMLAANPDARLKRELELEQRAYEAMGIRALPPEVLAQFRNNAKYYTPAGQADYSKIHTTLIQERVNSPKYQSATASEQAIMLQNIRYAMRLLYMQNEGKLPPTGVDNPPPTRPQSPGGIGLQSRPF